MAKKKKKSSDIRRKLQSKKLEERVEKGRRNAQGKSNSIIKDDNIPVWKPKEGEHIIDILPYVTGNNDRYTSEGNPTYTFEYEVHRNIGPSNSMFLCLAMYNKPCPVCEHRQQLIEQGAEKEVWKPLFPKKRNMYNVIVYDRGEEEKGVQVWDEAAFYSEKNIMAISKKRGRGGKVGKLTNFSDIDNGKSISFIIEPPVSKDDYRSYTGYAFEEREYDIDNELLEDCHCLDEIITMPEYDDIYEIYWGAKGKDDEEGKSKRRTRSKGQDEDQDDEEEETVDDLMEELADCEDLDDLEEFIHEHDIDYKIKKKTKFKKANREIEAMVLEDQDEDQDDEDEDEEEDQESTYTWADIAKMKKKQLKKIIKEEELDVDLDDAEDTKELRQMVAEELEIDDILE